MIIAVSLTLMRDTRAAPVETFGAVSQDLSTVVHAHYDSSEIIHVPGDGQDLQDSINQVADGGILELTAGTYPSPSGGLRINNVHKGFTIRAAPEMISTITAENTVLGQTTTFIGATEAGTFFVDDLTDLGINVYRMWTKMNELEPWDDDYASSDTRCENIGTPDIASIKADQPNGFVNTIPWDFWDNAFQNQLWWSGNSREDVIQHCVDNDITPVMVLRPVDDEGYPDRCSGNWAPRSSVDDGFLDEWWEHVFAIAYWLNVRHSYGVTHFQVLNEPDIPDQGWDGTQSEYVQLVETAYDAVKLANDIAGIDTYIHAPVVANYNSPYISYALDNADSNIALVDYHIYNTDPSTSINTIRATIFSHNPDGIIEPIWISEWGTYTSSYDDPSRAMTTAKQLMTFSEKGVEGITIFGMYDWGSLSGLLDTNRRKSETYYAYRLMTRGIIDAKDRISHTANGFLGNTTTMITRDNDYLYIIVHRDNVGQAATINVNLTALGSGSGTVNVWEYSGSNKDVIVETPTMTDASFSFTAPSNGISLAQISISDLVEDIVLYIPLTIQN